MVDVRALIAKQRAELDAAVPVLVEVELAGEVLTVGVRKLSGDDWQELVSKYPPRTGTTDDRVGFNQKDLPGGYPIEYLTVASEPIDADTWRDMYAVLTAPGRNALVATMWGENVMEPMKRLAEGKAMAGGSSGSPANRASRRAASKGGSPRSSRATSTTKKAG